MKVDQLVEYSSTSRLAGIQCHAVNLYRIRMCPHQCETHPTSIPTSAGRALETLGARSASMPAGTGTGCDALHRTQRLSRLPADAYAINVHMAPDLDGAQRPQNPDKGNEGLRSS